EPLQPLGLPLARQHDARTHDFGGVALLGAKDLLLLEAWDLDLDVDAIDQRPREALVIRRLPARKAFARPVGAVEVPARAGLRRDDDLELRRVRHRPPAPDARDPSVLPRAAAPLHGVS